MGRKPKELPEADEAYMEHAKGKQASKERRMKTLRVSTTTVILVPEENCNDEYREWYRVNRMGLKPANADQNQDPV